MSFMTDHMQEHIDDRRAYEKGIDDHDGTRRTYHISFRSGSVVMNGTYVTAKNTRAAVRKARKLARDPAFSWHGWSVYFVEIADQERTRRYGPFKYSRKWGES